MLTSGFDDAEFIIMLLIYFSSLEEMKFLNSENYDSSESEQKG